MTKRDDKIRYKRFIRLSALTAQTSEWRDKASWNDRELHEMANLLACFLERLLYIFFSYFTVFFSRQSYRLFIFLPLARQLFRFRLLLSHSLCIRLWFLFSHFLSSALSSFVCLLCLVSFFLLCLVSFFFLSSNRHPLLQDFSYLLNICQFPKFLFKIRHEVEIALNAIFDELTNLFITRAILQSHLITFFRIAVKNRSTQRKYFERLSSTSIWILHVFSKEWKGKGDGNPILRKRLHLRTPGGKENSGKEQTIYVPLLVHCCPRQKWRGKRKHVSIDRTRWGRRVKYIKKGAKVMSYVLSQLFYRSTRVISSWYLTDILQNVNAILRNGWKGVWNLYKSRGESVALGHFSVSIFFGK